MVWVICNSVLMLTSTTDDTNTSTTDMYRSRGDWLHANIHTSNFICIDSCHAYSYINNSSYVMQIYFKSISPTHNWCIKSYLQVRALPLIVVIWPSMRGKSSWCAVYFWVGASAKKSVWCHFLEPIYDPFHQSMDILLWARMLMNYKENFWTIWITTLKGSKFDYRSWYLIN
jgi:hypothetical protein